jgi:hypothetical protein
LNQFFIPLSRNYFTPLIDWKNTSIMALRVEVNGFGICKTGSPYSLFVICVQQEKFEAWAVYRRFQNFIVLRDQLISHHPAIPALPQIDYNNYDLQYLESVRVFLDRWLQSLTCNTYILRMQAMYQFLCIDANMQPPYLELYWANSFSSQTSDNNEMEMNEMFDEDDDDFPNDDHDYYDEDKESNDHMESVFDFGNNHNNHHNSHHNNNRGGGAGGNKTFRQPSPRANAKKRPSNPAINPPPMQIDEDENDAKEGMDIQSLSYVQAEFIYDKKEDDSKLQVATEVMNAANNSPNAVKRTISLEAFKIIKVIGKGK